MSEGVALVNDNLRLWRAAGAETMVPYFLGELGDAYYRAGDHTAALELLDEAMSVANRIGEHCHDATLHRVRGQIRLALGDRDQGFADLRAAVERARAQQALSFEIRSTVTLLTAMPDLPDREDWIAALESALSRLQSTESVEHERDARDLIARGRPV
jgi:predicted ATPase